MSGNVKSERSKKEWKELRRLGKTMREPRGKNKPEDNQELSMALFQVAFLGGCLEWEQVCQEWQECLDSMKLSVIQRFFQSAGARSHGGLPG